MSKRNPIKECMLCEEKKELQNSHIIPNFVYRKLKNENQELVLIKKYKNGKKEIKNNYCTKGENFPLLCKDCEQLFSINEKYFADNIFYPLLNNNILKNKDYDLEKIRYFLISLCWRKTISEIRNAMFSISFRDNNYKKSIIKDEQKKEILKNFFINFPYNKFEDVEIIDFEENSLFFRTFNKEKLKIYTDFIELYKPYLLNKQNLINFEYNVVMIIYKDDKFLHTISSESIITKEYKNFLFDLNGIICDISFIKRNSDFLPINLKEKINNNNIAIFNKLL